MGYADGYYYGQGRIRVDTSTFGVGDTIRVRSMTDSTKIYDKAVVTVGTPLIFTVPPYDLYKVCEIQEINNVVTELGGEYFNIGFGGFANATALNKGTLGGIQGILNAHQGTELLQVGDRTKITHNGTDWGVTVGAINLYHNNSVIMVSDELYSPQMWHSNTQMDVFYGDTTSLRASVQQFYSEIADKDKQFIKLRTKAGQRSAYNNNGWKAFDDYVWIPNYYEVVGSGGAGNPEPQLQFPIFVSSANRIKTYQGGAVAWWTCDGNPTTSNNTRQSYSVDTSGGVGSSWNYGQYGILPCFEMIADS